MNKKLDDTGWLEKTFGDSKDWDKMRLDNYKESQENPENMSYWLPALEESATRELSILKIPETMVIPLDFETWNWLRSDKYSVESVAKFDKMLEEASKDFRPNDDVLFMKTGIFSDKFTFSSTRVEDRSSIGNQFLDMYYQSMMFGAHMTNEVVLREQIEDVEGRTTIYSGMPLHTEFRVFYDFDKRRVIGVANYWHPENMEAGLYNDEDKEGYAKEKDRIVKEFKALKGLVATEVELHLQGATGAAGLTGKWSVDVMKNGKDFWLIDMARMELSALQNRIELAWEIDRVKELEIIKVALERDVMEQREHKYRNRPDFIKWLEDSERVLTKVSQKLIKEKAKQQSEEGKD